MQEDDSHDALEPADDWVGEQVSVTDLREKFRAVAVTAIPEAELREAEKALARAEREAKKEQARTARDAKKKQTEAEESRALAERDARAAHDAKQRES